MSSIQVHSQTPSQGRFQKLKNWWNGVPEKIEEDSRTKWYAMIG